MKNLIEYLNGNKNIEEEVNTMIKSVYIPEVKNRKRLSLDKKIEAEIYSISSKYPDIKKVVIFGSRARGDNSEKSDIDLAIYSEGSLVDFIEDIENNTSTLLEFDFSDMNIVKDKLFIDQVNKEGIIIYEKH